MSKDRVTSPASGSASRTIRVDAGGDYSEPSQMNTEEKVKSIQTILNIQIHNHADLLIDGIAGPKTQAAWLELTALKSGRAGWYSQYKGSKYAWVDTEDEPNSNALGVPDDQQGIAFPSRSTLGNWFLVTAPNGTTLRLQQTDLGPSTFTGRSIDIAAVAADRFGYSPANFPTGSIFYWAPAP